ncbi:hypothetical protein KIPB_009611 [Kipferlia bialata]|uniref:Chromatin associated protein KTI12 n=1 Tax=Kipferlia bialata TaxID=797122 RepID=A0A9K3GKW5_9EUKA|nr:hypothetical protein KIPB_009611 [Kipferlia bialata]|eukprot:g9611.t1
MSATTAPKNMKTLIFCALPASGKSESRKYLRSLTKEQNEEFHMGDSSTQVDDYPYVHMMRQIDDALEKHKFERVFFQSASQGFKDAYDWGVLIQLVNEDFADLLSKPTMPEEASATMWLLRRYDAAAEKVGMDRRITSRSAEELRALETELEEEVRALMVEKYEAIPESLEDKTVVIEFARGGPDGHAMPLPAPFGYEYSLSQLSPEILNSAALLYIWVTPQQSYDKNIARSTEKSNTESVTLSLNHGVPHDVMKGDYGCDDFEHLLKTSGTPNCLKLTKADGTEFLVPAAMFDNRNDLTTPFRQPEEEWAAEDVEKMSAAMKEAFGRLVLAYNERHSE